MLDSAISVMRGSLGMSGFEKVYSLFIVTVCLGEYIDFRKPDHFDGLAFGFQELALLKKGI